jgi:aquaporin Z
MIESFKQHWRVYLVEAWALGTFMIVACTVVILLEHPFFRAAEFIPSAFVRRMIIGAAMGVTAISLIYSKWGRFSGAHMNPAVTLANYRLDRIKLKDAAWYIVAQFFGATIAVLLLKLCFYSLLSHKSVNFIVTAPGIYGTAGAFGAELLLSLIMFTMVLIVGNSKWAHVTGYFAGLLVFLFIWLEAPISGMSINPARSFGSAFPANRWDSFWIYLVAPVAGMQIAAIGYRRFYLLAKKECRSMKATMSGEEPANGVYRVLRWFTKNQEGKTIEYNA